MNEDLKAFSIKLILTIPAILIGILSCLLVLFKPLIELWFPGKFEFENPKVKYIEIPTPLPPPPPDAPYSM
jgi:hypothetical protein